MNAKYKMHLLSTDSLIKILKERQNDYMYEAIIEAKQELENRNIDTSSFPIIKTKNISKKFNWSSFIGIVFSLCFIAGFITIDFLLFKYGIEESNYISIFFGVLLATLCLYLIGSSLFSEESKVNKLLGYSLVVIYMIFLGIIAVSLLILLFYLPFSNKFNLNIDLEILILKDKFVRFLIVVIDIYVLYKVIPYLKNRILSMMNKKGTKNYW